MKIEMPSSPIGASLWERCVPILAKCNSTGIICTIIRGDRECILFDSDNSITFSDFPYFENNYTIIRKYADGEKLVVTQ